jgi:hypothetical protein
MWQVLDAAVKAVADTRMPCALFRGFPGIAWVIQHVFRQRGEPVDAQSFSEIDAAIEIWVQRPGAATELMEGLGGILVYLAERGVDPQTRAEFERIVARLEDIALQKGGGRAWPVADWLQKDYEWHLTLSSRERFQLSAAWLEQGMQGYYKLSAAHGCLGTSAALAAAISAGFTAPAARSMAMSSARFVLSQELPAASPDLFPSIAGALLPKLTGGWCDGDTGIAALLTHIGNALDCDELHAEALRIARLEAGRRVRDVEPPNRRNYMLCHGSAGRAHIFNRLYQSTGESCFAEAAIYWIELTLSLRTAGQGTGGFLVDEQRKDGARPNVRGFLMGAAGLGLVLTAASFAIAPEWDRILVLSGRAA